MKADIIPKIIQLLDGSSKEEFENYINLQKNNIIKEVFAMEVPNFANSEAQVKCFYRTKATLNSFDTIVNKLIQAVKNDKRIVKILIPNELYNTFIDMGFWVSKCQLVW